MCDDKLVKKINKGSIISSEVQISLIRANPPSNVRKSKGEFKIQMRALTK